MTIPKRPRGRQPGTVSFASTLYLSPILDLLLARVPPSLQPEIRLGLQEALVNAVKHGNQLDPNKTIVVRFSTTRETYEWSISDQGTTHPSCCCQDDSGLPEDTSECGRGMFILHQIFDRVQWDSQRRELQLCKQVKPSHRWIA
ncbi:MAG TPA: anti-sigma regulatory factor [Oscillatoriales cyanobacterium M59_W2019_021]|nr:MAG: anti-sigma regulatory factor [Cyanobacteria bacterium J055]HIK30150.1 anti-sigma regulatory factor [Oscillatoriales cyanobacterium M4454_W2019_049]HIK52154.1 anti-sigma regulatory factor [Oscillatoriales cyanobacterium M59_W2019_021]